MAWFRRFEVRFTFDGGSGRLLTAASNNPTLSHLRQSDFTDLPTKKSLSVTNPANAYSGVSLGDGEAYFMESFVLLDCDNAAAAAAAACRCVIICLASARESSPWLCLHYEIAH